MWKYKRYNYQEFYHHGILGMKWGVINGPPYPLGSSDHNASERKAGWRKSLGGGRNEHLYDRKEKKLEPKENKEGLTVTQKVGLAACGVALVGIGGYALYKSGKIDGLVTLGKVLKEDAEIKIKSRINSSKVKDIYADAPLDIPRLVSEEPIDDIVINVQKGMDNVRNICAPTAVTSYFRGKGLDVHPKSENNIARMMDINNIFPEAKSDVSKSFQWKFASSPEKAKELLKKRFGNNAEGIVMFNWAGEDYGHGLNFKINNGSVRFFDGSSRGAYSDVWDDQNIFDMIDKEGPFGVYRLDNLTKINWDFLKDKVFDYTPW